ncbi:siroheme synthase [Magnetococcus marinus MC-1]|uniref:precorrin-2 dehydrogenase n=1 Tax=Magnetococcus marinus (strain ATCC BAA-1437 / JCM 17883 / MC-1) TaxID=156889 RepID=A0L7S4_MAGMM|nr:bifunctional precorrin-2 dehydrogenase/sirohydrochlorin ferrochelatase [Magnetococcus marinus]ABK44017.1 siroheme synthase [Magnetococcus marinus MC-1]
MTNCSDSPLLTKPQPFFMQLQGRRCLVVGADGEAAEKCEQLLQAGAQVIWLAPEPTAAMQRLMDAYPIEWVTEAFTEKWLQGVWLVLCSGTDTALLPNLFAACEARQIFLNVVDKPRYCSLIWPAQIQRGVVSVAISTGGASPALARWVREQIEALLPAQLGALALWLCGQREQVKTRLTGGFAQRATFWSTLFKEGLVECYVQQGEQAALGRVQQALEEVTNMQEKG